MARERRDVQELDLLSRQPRDTVELPLAQLHWLLQRELRLAFDALVKELYTRGGRT